MKTSTGPGDHNLHLQPVILKPVGGILCVLTPLTLKKRPDDIILSLCILRVISAWPSDGHGIR